MSSNKSPKSKSFVDVNNPSAQLEPKKSENKSGKGWLPWAKQPTKKYPTVNARVSSMPVKSTGEMPNSSSGCQENSEMSLPSARSLHISNSGRFKNKSQMRGRIMSLDSTTFVPPPPPPTMNRGSVSVDPTIIKSIAFSTTAPADFNHFASQQHQHSTKSPKHDFNSPKKTCGNFDIRLSSKPSSDLCTRKTGLPGVSLTGVDTSATHL